MSGVLSVAQAFKSAEVPLEVEEEFEYLDHIVHTRLMVIHNNATVRDSRPIFILPQLLKSIYPCEVFCKVHAVCGIDPAVAVHVCGVFNDRLKA